MILNLTNFLLNKNMALKILINFSEFSFYTWIFAAEQMLLNFYLSNSTTQFLSTQYLLFQTIFISQKKCLNF